MTSTPTEDYASDVDAGTEFSQPTIPEDLRRTVGYFAHALNQRLMIVLGKIDIALELDRPFDVDSETTNLGSFLSQLAEISRSFATRINSTVHNEIHSALDSIAHRASGLIQQIETLIELAHLDAWAQSMRPLAQDLRGIESMLPGKRFDDRTLTMADEALALTFGLDGNGNRRP